MDDDGHAIDYTLLASGVPVHAADGELVGTVHEVLDNARERMFDGIVIRTPDGQRFVDAPEVARIAQRRVTLTLSAREAVDLPVHSAPSAPADRTRHGWRRLLPGR